MTYGTPAVWLPRMALWIHDRLGLDFPPERWSELDRGIANAARENGYKDPGAYAHEFMALAPSAKQVEVLVDALTIGETYFFRERRSFEVLEHEILPPLIAAREHSTRCLRLWSAGCCTGEEAYSLAILVDRLLPRREGWHITILGTDVNPRYLRAAACGEFGSWSFRDAPAGLQERYFTPVGNGRFAIDPRIRQMVSLSELNLADATYPEDHGVVHSMDVILCRNVLMYFSAVQRQQVMDRLARTLVAGGWYSASATENSVKSLHSLLPVYFEGVVFHRKPGGGLTIQTPPHERALVEQAPPATLAPAPAVAPPVGPEQQPLATVEAPFAGPPSANACLDEARRHADAGRLGLARDTVEKALAVNKLDAGLHHLHAAILRELGCDAQARQAWRRAIYLDPGFVVAHHGLGMLALRQGLGNEARQHLQNVLVLLARQDAQAPLPYSDGLAAGHLKAMTETALARMAS